MRRFAAAALAVAQLHARAAQADEVVVTGSRAAPKAAKRPSDGAVTVVTGRELSDPGATAAEVLRAAPGVQVTDTGLLATASVRGAPAAEVPVYLAGIRLNDDVAGVADLSSLPLFAIERLEVYRGGAPVAADRLGIGGAIFLDPRRPRGPHLGASTETGSFGHRVARVSGAPVSGWLVAYEDRGVSNDFPYRDDRGTRFDPSDDVVRTRRNADQSARSFWLVGITDVAGAEVSVVAHAYDREAGVPGLGAVPALSARTTQRRRLAGVRAVVPCATEGRCEATLTTSFLHASSEHTDPAGELGLGPRSKSSGDRVDQAFSLRWDAGERVTVTPVASAAHETLVLSGGGELHATRIFSRAGVQAEARPARRVRLRALAVEECHGTSTGRARTCDVDVLTLRGAARIGSDELHLEATAGRYSRVATLGELFGVSGTVRGNPKLAPERGTLVEVGGRATGRRTHVEAWVFGRWSDDLIAYQQTAVGYVRPYNVGRARTVGLEVTARAVPTRHLAAEVAVSLLDARDVSPHRALTQDLLPYRARLVAVPRVETWAPAGPLRLTADVRWMYQASRTADPAGLVILPAQGSLDVSLGLALSDGRIAMRARAANVLDKARFDAVGYPLPGRAYYASMDVRCD